MVISQPFTFSFWRLLSRHMRSSYRFCAFLKKTEVVLVERRSLASYGILTMTVCLSVCPSQADIVSKWLNIGSRKIPMGSAQ